MMRASLMAGAALVLAGASASAACRDDLIKADQNFAKTRSELQGTAGAAAPAKCAAYRKHVASLTEVRNVFARCDTGSDKANCSHGARCSIPSDATTAARAIAIYIRAR